MTTITRSMPKTVDTRALFREVKRIEPTIVMLDKIAAQVPNWSGTYVQLRNPSRTVQIVVSGSHAEVEILAHDWSPERGLWLYRGVRMASLRTRAELAAAAELVLELLAAD